MSFYVSPLVDIREIDLSTTIPGVATSIGAIVLRDTWKGPERKQTLITNIDELIEQFGEPTNAANNYRDMFSAIGHLRYGNKLYCTRVMPPSATFAGTKGASGAVVTFTPFTTGNAYVLTDFSSQDPDEFPTEVSPTGQFDPFWTIAKSRGAWGNNIRIGVFDKTAFDGILAGGASYTGWNTYSEVTKIDTSLDDGTGTTNRNFLVVIQSKEQSETAYSTKEWFNVSTDTTKKDGQGQLTFAENVINTRSNYIRISMRAGAKNKDIDIGTSDWQSFAGGQDSLSDVVTNSSVIYAYNLYQNPDEIDVNIFIDSDKSDAVKNRLIAISEERKDSMALIDCQYAQVVYNNGSEAEDLRVYRRTTLNPNTSYAAMYGNWLEMYDKFNGVYRWIPASGTISGIFANTDNLADPWFAPAGPNRAILNNVRKLAWNPTLGERDIIYKNGINPIVSLSGYGKMVYGNKTLLNKESAFSRINVRRLFSVLEKSISTSVTYFLFEPNDPLTRVRFINMVEPYLRDVKGRRGIYDYRVICDSTNNTDARIDRNELWADIYIKPVRSAEFIVLSFIATQTGASFSEIAAAAF